jgi:hypothetical protein
VRAREHVLEGCAEVAQVHRPVRDQEELGERELALAEDAEGRGHGLALVALLHDSRGERVVTGLSVRPQVHHPRHHEGEQGRKQLLEQVAEVEVLLPRLAHDGGRVDRIASMAEVRDLEHRVVVPQRVVAVVVAEGALGPPNARRDLADERELGIGRPGHALRDPGQRRRRSPAISEASIISGRFSGRGATAARIRAGGPPRNTVTGSASPRASATA